MEALKECGSSGGLWRPWRTVKINGDCGGFRGYSKGKRMVKEEEMRAGGGVGGGERGVGAGQLGGGGRYRFPSERSEKSLRNE